MPRRIQHLARAAEVWRLRGAGATLGEQPEVEIGHGPCPLARSEDLTRWRPGGPLMIERTLQDHHGRCLVDLLSALAGASLRCRRDQATGGRDGGQPLVHQAYRYGCHQSGHGARIVARGDGRRTLGPVQSTGAARRPPRRLPAPRPALATPSRSVPPLRRGAASRPGWPASPTGSLAATPTRTEPTSTPIRTPGRTSRCRPAGRPGLVPPRAPRRPWSTSVPPPWARSSLPPPPPPSTPAPTRTSSPALMPARRGHRR